MMENPKGYANPQLLIGPRELPASSRQSSRPTLARSASRRAVRAGHLPHAVHLDLFGVSLTDTDPAPLKAFLWMIEHLLATRGVSADRPVVVYESDPACAPRGRSGFSSSSAIRTSGMLDGGVRAWTAAGLPLTTRERGAGTTSWNGERQGRGAGDMARRRRSAGSARCRDSRHGTDGEYCGTTVRAARGGAIPGAVHLEWTRNLGADGAFKPAAELTAMYEEAGDDAGSGGGDVLPGRLPRRAQLSGAAAARLSADCATTSARGKNGAIGTICRSRNRAIEEIEERRA